MNSHAANKNITYPTGAFVQGASGIVDVLYDINTRGQVENIRFQRDNPLADFEKDIERQMHQWSFERADARRDIPLRLDFRINRSSRQAD
ncbi:energy transducer TonB [Enterobacterales bacterium CwR94]|nr:energy transducer TonB [Enterobacterales bacterium CwR94]